MKPKLLDKEEMKDRAILQTDKGFICHWCKKAFTFKKNFEEHYCRIIHKNYRKEVKRY